MDKSIIVKILFFAKSSDLVGKSEGELFLKKSDATLEELLVFIEESYPALKALCHNYIIAHNLVYISDKGINLRFRPGDEVAIIPPLSGG